VNILSGTLAWLASLAIGSFATLVLWAYLIVAHDLNRIAQLLVLFVAFAMLWYATWIYLSRASSASHVRRRSWLATKFVVGIAVALAALWVLTLFGGTDDKLDSALTCADCTVISVTRVIDGDTLVSGTERVRLYGIDAPEVGERCADGATRRLVELAGDEVRIEAGPRRTDVYGRQLAYLYTKDGRSIDELLISGGHAVAWERDGQHREFLMSLERKARTTHVGCLW